MSNLEMGRLLQGKVSKESKILDIGTGTGMTARYLTSTFGARVVGIDTSLEMLSRAQALDGLDITFKQGNALSLPLAESFDVIIMGYLLRHIEPKDAPQVFLEASRVSRPGTILMVADLFLPKPGPQQVLGVWYLHDPVTLTQLAMDAGFTLFATRYLPLSILLAYQKGK